MPIILELLCVTMKSILLLQLASEVKHPWKVAVPPHKQRFLYIDGKSPIELTEAGINLANRIGPQELPNFKLLAETEANEVDQN